MLVSLMNANSAPMGKGNVYISQLSVTIRNGPTSPAYTQAMNDYRSSWVRMGAWLTGQCLPVFVKLLYPACWPADAWPNAT
jgi:hypothetical protein